MKDNLVSFQSFHDLKGFLNLKYDQYNRPDFIENDPVCIPHLFTKKQDIEIMAFWASILAWGQRKTIINKCKELIQLMDGAPHDFILNHKETDLKRFANFKHRTFNLTDTLYFIEFFRQHYLKSDTLETAFNTYKSNNLRHEFVEEENYSSGFIENASSPCYLSDLNNIPEIITETALNSFRTYFFSLPDYPARTKKHISSPSQKSTCKRLNMFLRWMVRKDDRGVDFGLWSSIKPSDLVCPTDLHVERVARRLKLITRKQVDWQTATELTENLRQFDPLDPVKYDFALFGLGIEGHFQNQTF
jgi:uncharacterized protein (TIGR02757 family)